MLHRQKSKCILIFLLIFQFSHACYFTNCPWGGKRIFSNDQIKYCSLCADGLGMCFGPSTCCGPDIGCLLQTKESIPCQLEDVKSSEPCKPYGKKCFVLNFGRCAALNLCCNAVSCSYDLNCDNLDQTPDDQNPAHDDKLAQLKPKALKFM